LGVWLGAELLSKLDGFKAAGDLARDHFLMDKLRPRQVDDVSFVREGAVIAQATGVQELGLYGVFLGDGVQEELAQCVGYLVRTKPEWEADGGVCKGVAVVDALVMVDDEADRA